MALVQLPVNVAFSGPADMSFAKGQDLLDMLVQASKPTSFTGPVASRTLVPYFGSSEPVSKDSKSGTSVKTPQTVPSRTRKTRGDPVAGRSNLPSRAVKARPSSNKPPLKVWASCMTSPNPEDIPLPSQALLGRVRSAAV